MNRKLLIFMMTVLLASASQLTGDFQVKVSGVLSDGYHVEEVWQRVK
jgi:hypothetical protein